MATPARLLQPALNPTGLMAAAGAIYAAVVMVTNAVHGHGVIDTNVILGAVAAAAGLYARAKVTPVADPKDGNGNPLVAAPAAAAPSGGRITSGPGDAVPLLPAGIPVPLSDEALTEFIPLITSDLPPANPPPPA
jgi:hypothetical protein